MAIFNAEIFEGARGFFDWLVRAKTAMFVGKVMSALGLGFVANKFLYDPMIAQAQMYWSAIPAQAATWVHALGIDTGVSLILSAYGLKNASRIFMRKVEASGSTGG